MKPSKPSPFDVHFDDEPDISDIAEIVQKLNNYSRPQSVKPYSEYDPESIFPPPSHISANPNDNESEKSKSINFVNHWKRNGLSESKDEISFGSKYEQKPKKIKKIEPQKVPSTPQLTFGHQKEDQISNKQSLPNVRQSIQPISPSTNFKITDYFAHKKIAPKSKIHDIEDYEIRQELKPESLPQKLLQKPSTPIIQEQKSSPLINSLIEKNLVRTKHIQELKAELAVLQSKRVAMLKTNNESKQKEKEKLKLKLFETYQRKIQFNKFKSHMHQYLNHERLHGAVLPELNNKIKNLEEHKKKVTQKKGGNKKQVHTDEESIGNNGQNVNYSQNPNQIPEKKAYTNQWMSRLEKFKEKIEADETYYQKLHEVKRKTEEISEEMRESFEKNNFLKDYALYSIEYPYGEQKKSAQEIAEIQAFNTELLRPEILTLLKYPKLCSEASKKGIEQSLSDLFNESKRLHNFVGQYFLQTTMASHAGQNNEYILYGRQKNEDFENLTDVLTKYEPFSEVMIRYIARICLIALEQIKIQVLKPVFFLPFNIYFTPKYDIKFSNIVMNKIFLQEEFKPYLKENNLYYFVAPEAFSQKDESGLPFWSLGILLYYIIYEKYPFEYELQAVFQKETFFIYNQLVFPSKPVVNQKLKDFITVCLSGKQRDLSQLQRHAFFHK